MRSCVLVCMLACWAPFCSHDQFSSHCQTACHIPDPKGKHVNLFKMRCKVGKGFYSVPVKQNSKLYLSCAH